MQNRSREDRTSEARTRIGAPLRRDYLAAPELQRAGPVTTAPSPRRFASRKPATFPAPRPHTTPLLRGGPTSFPLHPGRARDGICRYSRQIRGRRGSVFRQTRKRTHAAVSARTSHSRSAQNCCQLQLRVARRLLRLRVRLLPFRVRCMPVEVRLATSAHARPGLRTRASLKLARHWPGARPVGVDVFHGFERAHSRFPAAGFAARCLPEFSQFCAAAARPRLPLGLRAQARAHSDRGGTQPSLRRRTACAAAHCGVVEQSEEVDTPDGMGATFRYPGRTHQGRAAAGARECQGPSRKHLEGPAHAVLRRQRAAAGGRE